LNDQNYLALRRKEAERQGRNQNVASPFLRQAQDKLWRCLLRGQDARATKSARGAQILPMSSAEVEKKIKQLFILNLGASASLREFGCFFSSSETFHRAGGGAEASAL
jgi:hypothetical protein